MTLEERIAELRRTVARARSMPMSASALVHRSELLSTIDELAEATRTELAEAARLLSAKEEVVDEGRRRAQELIAEARDVRQRLASDTEVLRHARERADAELASARAQAQALREEADDYVDTKLAGLEVALERSLAMLRHGEEHLAAADVPGVKDALARSLAAVRRGRERLGTGDGTGLEPDRQELSGSDLSLPRHLEG